MPTAAFAQDASNIWSGGYIGLDLGGGMGSVSVTDNVNDGVPPGPFDYTTKDLVADLKGGFNLQAGAFVLGLEGKVGYLDPIGSGIVPSSNPGHHQDLTITPGATAELTGHVGIGIDKTLLYVKGGAVIFGGSAQQVTDNPGYKTDPSGAFTGWTAGLGIEQMLSDKMGLTAEYAHTVYSPVTADQENVGDPSSPLGYKFLNWTSFSTDTITVGVNVLY